MNRDWMAPAGAGSVDPGSQMIGRGDKPPTAESYLPQNLPESALDALRHALSMPARSADYIAPVTQYINGYVAAIKSEGLCLPQFLGTSLAESEPSLTALLVEISLILSLDKLRRKGLIAQDPFTTSNYLSAPLKDWGVLLADGQTMRAAFPGDKLIEAFSRRVDKRYKCEICDRKSALLQNNVLDRLLEITNDNLRHYDDPHDKPEMWAWRPFGALILFESCCADLKECGMDEQLASHGVSSISSAITPIAHRLSEFHGDCLKDISLDHEKADAWATAFSQACEGHPQLAKRKSLPQVALDQGILACLAFERMVTLSDQPRFVHIAGKLLTELMDSHGYAPLIH